ncbi:MAG: nucleoside 2-deoxyribosyltransferase [Isosphaeraceae bacterium]
MRIYFAGPLFTQAEREWNRALADSLIVAGHSVFLPQEEIKDLESLDAEAIFQLDVDGVRSSDAILAILDGADPDSGTCFECGLAFALRLPILVVRTDFRAGGDALPGQKLPAINLMLSQSATKIVSLVDPSHSFETLVSLILAALAELIPGSESI